MMKFLVGFVLGMCLMTWAGCDFMSAPASHEVSACDLQKQEVQLQIESTKKQELIEQEGAELRITVAKLCVSKGGLPQVFQGNVTCSRESK